MVKQNITAQNYIFQLLYANFYLFVSFIFKKMKNKKFAVGPYYAVFKPAAGFFFKKT